jgi:hypothetical protein
MLLGVHTKSLLVVAALFIYGLSCATEPSAAGRRVRTYLNSLAARNVGPGLRDVIEGNAEDDGGRIPWNVPNLQVNQQKVLISNHLRTHQHFGNAPALLAENEDFMQYAPHPSTFVMSVVNNRVNADSACNNMIDLLLSGRVSFEVGPMQAAPRSNRFLLFANLSGHNIIGLDASPCLYNVNPLVPLVAGTNRSGYVQLIVSLQTRFGGVTYAAPQSMMITLYPANAPGNAGGPLGELPPVAPLQLLPVEPLPLVAQLLPEADGEKRRKVEEDEEGGAGDDNANVLNDNVENIGEEGANVLNDNAENIGAGKKKRKRSPAILKNGADGEK